MASLNRNVQRMRRDDEVSIPNPKSLKYLVISVGSTITEKENAMLLYDSGGDRSRFIIFSTQENINVLADCQEWAGDGTFSCVPSIFKQLYTIHGVVKDKLLPLVYILMPNNNEERYSKVLLV